MLRNHSATWERPTLPGHVFLSCQRLLKQEKWICTGFWTLRNRSTKKSSTQLLFLNSLSLLVPSPQLAMPFLSPFTHLPQFPLPSNSSFFLYYSAVVLPPPRSFPWNPQASLFHWLSSLDSKVSLWVCQSKWTENPLETRAMFFPSLSPKPITMIGAQLMNKWIPFIYICSYFTKLMM